MKRLFLDTEFTGFATIISLALYNPVNNSYFYAEFNDYDKSQIDPWLEEKIIPSLKWYYEEEYLRLKSNDFPGTIENGYVEMKGNTEQIRENLTEWLGKNEHIEIVADVGHYDFMLFIDIFDDLPRNICPAYVEFNDVVARYYQVSPTIAFNLDRFKLDDMGSEKNRLLPGKLLPEKKHNVMANAMRIADLWEMYKGEGK